MINLKLYHIMYLLYFHTAWIL